MMTQTPSMNLTESVPSSTVSIQTYANNNNGNFTIIDQHDHSSGQGVQVTPSGLLINTDLPININNLTTIRTTRFSPQSSVLTNTADIGCLYVIGVDLYYNDGNGNNIRITQSGSVSGSAGTITGLPSGTASASFGGGAFSFESAASTPATMNVGPLVIGAQVANSKTVTLEPPNSLASSYTLVLPSAQGAANTIMVNDGSGDLSFTTTLTNTTLSSPTINNATIASPTITNPSISGATITGTPGIIPLGGIIATYPSAGGAYNCTATTTPDSLGFVLCQGQSVSGSVNSAPNLNSGAFLWGNSTSGGSGGSTTQTLTSSNFAHVHNYQHDHQWGYFNDAQNLYGLDADGSAIGSAGFTTGAGTTVVNGALLTNTSGITYTISSVQVGVDTYMHTGGVIDNHNGTGTGTGAEVSGVTSLSASSFSIMPPYVNVVYIMRAN